jgi:hypothetical protein
MLRAPALLELGRRRTIRHQAGDLLVDRLVDRLRSMPGFAVTVRVEAPGDFAGAGGDGDAGRDLFFIDQPLVEARGAVRRRTSAKTSSSATSRLPYSGCSTS